MRYATSSVLEHITSSKKRERRCKLSHDKAWFPYNRPDRPDRPSRFKIFRDDPDDWGDW